MFVTASCTCPFLNAWKRLCSQNIVLEIIDATLSGFAQIAFNDNSFSGLLLIAVTAIGSPIQAVSGVWGALIATLTAYLIGVPKGLIRCGLYGFNAALAGVAIPLLVFPGQGITVSLLLFTALAAIGCVFMSAALGSFFGKWGSTALALPYCVTLLLLVPASVLITTMDVTRAAPAVIELSVAQAGWTGLEFFTATLAGIAQVLWVERPVCGILYLIALLPASRLDVVNSVVGAVAGTAVAVALGLPKDAIILGLYGYNGVLLMKVFTRGFAFSRRSYLMAVCAAGATSLIAAGLKVIFAPLGLSSFLAFPYALLCAFLFIGRDKLSGVTYIPPKNWGVPETLAAALKNGNIDLS